MANEAEKDTRPKREKWLVFSFVLWSVRIRPNNMPPLGDLIIKDQNLVLKPYFDVAYGSFQFTPQQVSKISPSKIAYFVYSPLLLFIFAWILIAILVFGNSTPAFIIVVAIISVVLVICPLLFLKPFRIRHNIGSYPSYIYFLCLRHHSSSIRDALTRCGFGDKLEQPHGDSKPDHAS
jgi:hypothetical protein